MGTERNVDRSLFRSFRHLLLYEHLAKDSLNRILNPISRFKFARGFESHPFPSWWILVVKARGEEASSSSSIN